MTAQLTYTTRKRAHSFSVADEKEKDKIRKEYKRQDEDTPYRLFVSTPCKPTVHTMATRKAANEVFNMYEGRARLVTNMKTGRIVMYAEK